jgi:hypothetical protein
VAKARASTSFFLVARQDVDGRDKIGHDDLRDRAMYHHHRSVSFSSMRRLRL